MNKSNIRTSWRRAALLLVWALFFWGCRGREIARPTPYMDIEPHFWVRVLLLNNASSCDVMIRSGCTISGGEWRQPRLRAKVEMSSANISFGGRAFAASVVILPDKPHIFNLNGDDYRGKLEIKVSPDGKSFDAINHVPLEPYLAGVVGAEMPNYWEPEALRAQAIAARTYCLYAKKTAGAKRDWDVTKTTASQVYSGVKAESLQVWDAVNETTGEVLVCGGPTGQDEIFPAYYSSACGGHTEDSRNVFGDSFGPLCGVACPYCRDVAKPSIFYWPMTQFSKSEVTARMSAKYPKLTALGEISKIEPTKKSDYEDFSRITLVRITGTNGKSDSVRGEDLRLTIDPSGARIRSISCTIMPMGESWAFLSGRGYGHGVGLCQCGAEGMARAGKKTEEILSYYYPGSRPVRIY